MQFLVLQVIQKRAQALINRIWVQEQCAMTINLNSIKVKLHLPACECEKWIKYKWLNSMSSCVRSWIRLFSGVTRPSIVACWIHTVWELVFPVKPWTFLKTKIQNKQTHAPTHTPLTQQTKKKKYRQTNDSIHSKNGKIMFWKC